MDIDKATKEKIQDMQLTEQSLQNFSLQKQAFQLELNETESTLEEVKKTKSTIYKISGQIMLKTEKQVITKELESKIQTLKLRISSFAKQEALLEKKSRELRAELEKKLAKDNN